MNIINIRLMQLQSNPKSHHIETNPVSLDTAQSHDLDQMSHDSVFNVVGRAVGHTHLVFNVTSPTGHVISSSPASVQVFDALKLSPKYIILLPTATFQVHTPSHPHTSHTQTHTPDPQQWWAIVGSSC